jgi:hypothetical protein
VQSISRALVLLFAASTLAACGGSQPEAKEPSEETPKAAEEKAAPSDEKETSTASDDEKKPDAKKDKAASAAPDPDAMPKRTLKDMLTASGALFVFSFTASDVHKAADEKCAKSAKDDPKKKADCMTKASEKLENDAFQFTEAGENKGVWATLRRKGNSLSTVRKVDVEFGKETDKSITLVPKTGKEVVIEVPSEGQIAIDDPKNGKMVYELKLGLLGDQAR